MKGLQERLFRKVALERLSSPEQLDMLMRVITPRAWLALLPLLALIGVAVLWGWMGSIPTKVAGRCILINPTGLADVVSISSGRITEVSVRVGDSLEAGQEVARVSQPELLDRIEKAEARLRELEGEGAVVRSFAAQGKVLTVQNLAQQRAALENRLKAAHDRARLAAERARTEQTLLDQGLITAQMLVETRQEEVAARLEAEGLQGQIKQLDLRRMESDKQGRSEVATIEAQISEARRALDSLEEQRKQAVSITSPFAGRVVEIKAGRGMLVSQGSSVLTVERAGPGGGLEAIVYVSAADGKKVRPKMEAQIVPSTVKREEHGFMLGTISYVSDYPATPQSMMLLLQNEILVKELAGGDPPIEIHAALAASNTRSGYRWSSAAGPQVTITSGTLCRAEIVVERQRPMALVIPILKKTAGLD